MSIFDALRSGDCEQILTHIAQINRTNEIGDTPLLVAIQKRNVKAIKVLLEHVADIEAQSKNGKTSLHYAVVQGRIDIVTLLLDCGANIEAADKNGNTPLIFAAWLSQLQIAKLLLQRGANVNCTGQDGTTPLIDASACSRPLVDMVKLLLQYGADPNLGNTAQDSTALCWASEKGHHDIAKILLDAGSNAFHIIQNDSSVLSLAKDHAMERLICEYQREEGPSWLVRELSSRVSQWPLVCGALDKLRLAGLGSRESFVLIPCALFTHTYLQDIGIDILAVRCAVLEMRAQVTWLGARLASQGESVANMLVWEDLVYDVLGCSTEASFAALPASALHDSVLLRLHSSPVVCERLRVVHQQVRAEHAVTTSVTETNTSGAPVSALGVAGPSPPPPATGELSKPSRTPAGQQEGVGEAVEQDEKGGRRVAFDGYFDSDDDMPALASDNDDDDVTCCQQYGQYWAEVSACQEMYCDAAVALKEQESTFDTLSDADEDLPSLVSIQELRPGGDSPHALSDFGSDIERDGV